MSFFVSAEDLNKFGISLSFSAKQDCGPFFVQDILVAAVLTAG
jgi:hypothetical protein